MIKRLLIVLMAAGLFSVGAVAQAPGAGEGAPPAQQPGQPGQEEQQREQQPFGAAQDHPSFDELDADNTGIVTREEAEAELPCLVDAFDDLEGDQEGLSRIEYNEAVREHC